MPDLPVQSYWKAPAECLPYDPLAPEVADRVIGMIEARSPGLWVEHVGSTSVPGCVGKGVVDLVIPYWQGQLEAAKRVLEELGFQRQSNRDPFPEDRPLRVGSVEHTGRRFRMHVHVVDASSKELEELRAFRNRLRADPDLLADYVRRKRLILKETVDPSDYAVIKGDFVRDSLDNLV